MHGNHRGRESRDRLSIVMAIGVAALVLRALHVWVQPSHPVRVRRAAFRGGARPRVWISETSARAPTRAPARAI